MHDPILFNDDGTEIPFISGPPPEEQIPLVTEFMGMTAGEEIEYKISIEPNPEINRHNLILTLRQNRFYFDLHHRTLAESAMLEEKAEILKQENTQLIRIYINLYYNSRSNPLNFRLYSRSQ